MVPSDFMVVFEFVYGFFTTADAFLRGLQRQVLGYNMI